jgi:hypothetical protein
LCPYDSGLNLDWGKYGQVRLYRYVITPNSKQLQGCHRIFLFFQLYYDEDNVATLIIREVFPEDAGKFTCVAKNAAGFASSTTELIVEAPLSDHGSDTTISISRKSLSR